jgi:hypothetical protein
MKTRVLPLLFIIGMALIVGTAGVALARVFTDYNHHTDFSRYHTYSWIGVKAGNSLWQDRIQAAVDSQLAARGWMRVPSGGDAGVSAFGRTRQQDISRIRSKLSTTAFPAGAGVAGGALEPLLPISSPRKLAT